MRIWGFYNEKIRKSWIQYTSEIDNLAGLYLSTSIFCDYVSRYVTKKLIELENSRDMDNQNKNEKKFINLENYKYVSNNDQIRAKQEKMNELLTNNNEGYGVSTRRANKKYLVKHNRTASSNKVFFLFVLNLIEL